jgi:hypothetical protein
MITNIGCRKQSRKSRAFKLAWRAQKLKLFDTKAQLKLLKRLKLISKLRGENFNVR